MPSLEVLFDEFSSTSGGVEFIEDSVRQGMNTGTSKTASLPWSILNCFNAPRNRDAKRRLPSTNSFSN